ncbi:MAG TPA: hypothetical protein DCQ06_08085 [Myxococcales bacterium]|nr:hypothetical protein [Myxococcales bacterium]
MDDSVVDHLVASIEGQSTGAHPLRAKTGQVIEAFLTEQVWQGVLRPSGSYVLRVVKDELKLNAVKASQAGIEAGLDKTALLEQQAEVQATAPTQSRSRERP